VRLSDHLMLARGGSCDIGGIFTNTCAAILDAERFELSDDVARAAYNLTKSKPTTLISALPLVRSPYRKMWLEWRGGLTSTMIKPEHKRDSTLAPDPIKQGCLIETDGNGQLGTMTFAWLHKEKPERFSEDMYSPVNIAPLGALFNWAAEADVFDDAMREYKRRYPTPEQVISDPGMLDLMMVKHYTRGMTDETAKLAMDRLVFKGWSKLSDIASERHAFMELEKHVIPWIVPHAHGFFKWVAGHAMKSEAKVGAFIKEIVQGSWEPDIEGEPPFVETVIAMMNSRNAIETRDVDLDALNKARAKRGRPKFLPYRTTHLRLSQAQTRAFRAGLLSKEDAGRHRVRGHFKIRRTGVYWWSPFYRGDPLKPLPPRQEYTVDA
jgi:hypothetical protein